MQRIVRAQGKDLQNKQKNCTQTMSTGFNFQLFFWDILSRIPLLLKIDSTQDRRSQCPHHTVWTTNIRLSYFQTEFSNEFCVQLKKFHAGPLLRLQQLHKTSHLAFAPQVSHLPQQNKNESSLQAAESQRKNREETPNVAKTQPANAGWDSHLPSERTGKYSGRDFFFPPCFSKDF